MNRIEISVQNRVAWQTNSVDYICGNGDFVVGFVFDSEWDEYETKTARFIYNGEHTDIVFTGTECKVPKILNVKRMEVGVFAGDLYTTTPAFVHCRKSILCDSGAPADPMPDVYAQIMELLKNVETGSSGDCLITRIESMEETGIRNLRELDSGIYILYGYFNAYPGAASYMPFDNRFVTVEKQAAGSHLFVFQTLNAKVDFHEILVDESEIDGFTHTKTEIDLLSLQNNVNSSIIRVSEVNLLADKWDGSENLYSQVVTIDGITEYSQIDLTPSVEQLVIFHEKDLTFVTENEDGVVTVYAIGQKPENDYTIQVTIKEVNA